MVSSTHIATAITFGVPISYGLSMLSDHIFLSPIFLFFLIVGSLFPDIDTPKSKIGKVLFFISIPISFFIKHRGITHTLIFAILVSIGLYFLIEYLSEYLNFYNIKLQEHALEASIGFFIGNIMHLVGDMHTYSGVSLFYPLSNKRVRILPKIMLFQTGTVKESYYNIIYTVSASIIMYYFIKLYGY